MRIAYNLNKVDFPQEMKDVLERKLQRRYKNLKIDKLKFTITNLRGQYEAHLSGVFFNTPINVNVEGYDFPIIIDNLVSNFSTLTRKVRDKRK